MDLAELQKLIAAGESETVEFKQSTAQLTRVGETLCGFLNASGGEVLIGIAPTGKIVGQQVADSTLRDIAAVLDRFEPPVHIAMQRIQVEQGRQVIVLGAPAESESVPFTYNGRAYQRIGSTTSVMPQERYQQLLLERSYSQHRWENRPAIGVKLTDLDDEEIRRTVRLGIEAGRMPEVTGSDIADILDRLGIRQHGHILHAAVVLFGSNFLPDYPQCQLRMARFKGIDKSEFLDQRQLYGHAFHLLGEAMLFLRRHLPVAGRILPGVLERQDEPLFPLAALREAVVNALCHRTYTHPGGAVSVAIFDDRLEIWSDGTLPFGLRPEDLKQDHPSRPRNPLITSVFYRRGLIEQWGRGTQKIVELCVKAGHPEPEFAEQAGTVVVRFLPRGYIAPQRIAHDLTQRQREILQILAGRDAALREMLTALSHPSSERALRDDLYHLKRLGLIETRGHGRGATWFLVQGTEGLSKM